MLENWSDAPAHLLRAFPSAAPGANDEVRLTLHGQPLLAWRGVSSRRGNPDVVHLAAPVLDEPGSDAGAGVGDGAGEGAGGSAGTSAGAGAAPATTEAELLARFGIDPSGPDIVELTRAAEKFPLGGLRLLGGRPHVHSAVEFPVEEAWLASAAKLIAAEAKALGQEGANGVR